MKKYDLIVLGGGFAGSAAAIAAGRAGLSVLLIEKGNSLGGSAANSLVNPFMPNLTKIDSINPDERTFLSKGLYTEILGRLDEMGALIPGHAPAFHEEYLKLLLNRMAAEAGVELLYHSFLCDVTLEKETLRSVTVTGKSGKLTFEADTFVDATGDGDLAVLAGCPHHLGRDGDHLCQPMTLCFRVGNVDLAKYRKARPSINALYKQAQAEGKIKNPREDVLIFDTLIDGVLHFNSTRVVKRNPVDVFDLTKAEIEAREQVFELLAFMKENVDGFQNASLLSTAAQIGVRESRMIEGEYLLTGEDLVACKKFDDSIALGNYDIDIHNPEGSGTSHYYFPEGQYYSVPYRSLLAKKTTNLLVAGRCISADHEAQASIRIMPIVCCLGEAAGSAAAVAKKQGATLRTLDVAALRAHLAERGAMV